MNKNKAIRLFCVECSGDSPDTVAVCTAKECQLWPFRLGDLIGSKGYDKRVAGLWKRGEAMIKDKKKKETELGRAVCWQGDKPSAGELVEECQRDGLGVAFFTTPSKPLSAHKVKRTYRGVGVRVSAAPPEKEENE